MTIQRQLLLLTILFVAACKKDVTNPPTPPAPVDAVFTFTASGSNCSNSIVQGVYTIGTVIGVANTVSLEVNVTTIGKFAISTNTVNGYSFASSGSLNALGIQRITMTGKGTPYIAGTNSFVISAGTSSCSFSVTATDYPLNDNDHMLFGNPSAASFTIDSINNYLMRKSYYALSYSRDRGTPNWVSWHLFDNDLGTVPRQDDFRADNTLPPGWYRVPDYAYTGTGFDKGHNTPSGDRTNTVEANSATFLMTNMIPQAPYHNQTVWSVMEDSLRKLVYDGNELYIVMGSYGIGGTGANGYATTINSGTVTVPASIWKIAVVIPNGNNDSSRVNQNTRVIAVNIPNTNSLNSSWKYYRVKIDAIEAATGYDLLSRLPTALQGVLEAKIDNL